MHSLAILLKSFAGDLEYARRLLVSFTRFNVDAIPLFVVVPDGDIEAFSPCITANMTLVPESALGRYLVTEPVHGIRPGYINQEIIKLAFWELGLADNYFCVDSDAEFIRPIHWSDFMHDEGTPYSVLVEDNELRVEPRYFE